MRKKIMKIIWIVPLLVALMALAFPATAFANEGGNRTPISCALTLGVIDPGDIVQRGNLVRTTGEMTAGYLDCDVDDYDGGFSTTHNSRVRVNPLDGSFKGRLKGTFELDTNLDGNADLTGAIRARISGSVISLLPTPDGPVPIHSVTDVGRWRFDDDDVKGGGKFTITLVGVVGIPAALGGLANPSPFAPGLPPGSLTGKVKDTEGHHEEDDD